MSEPLTPGRHSGINHLAIIIDGQVSLVLSADNQLTAALTSEPTIKQFNPQEQAIIPGFLYDAETDTFTAPDKQ